MFRGRFSDSNVFNFSLVLLVVSVVLIATMSPLLGVVGLMITAFVLVYGLIYAAARDPENLYSMSLQAPQRLRRRR